MQAKYHCTFLCGGVKLAENVCHRLYGTDMNFLKIIQCSFYVYFCDEIFIKAKENRCVCPRVVDLSPSFNA